MQRPWPELAGVSLQSLGRVVMDTVSQIAGSVFKGKRDNMFISTSYSLSSSLCLSFQAISSHSGVWSIKDRNTIQRCGRKQEEVTESLHYYTYYYTYFTESVSMKMYRVTV